MKMPSLLSASLLLLLFSEITPETQLQDQESRIKELHCHTSSHLHVYGSQEGEAKPSRQNNSPLCTGSDQTPFSVLVTDSVTHTPNKTYSTYVVYRGILLGGLSRLQNSTKDFTFTYTEDPNYGPFLQSVNGLSGSEKEHTYWELLVNTTKKTIIRPDVGIGCYIPNANEQIILKYNKY